MTATAADITGECRAAVFCIGGAGANIAAALMDHLVNADVITVNTANGTVSGSDCDIPLTLPGDVASGDVKGAKEVALQNETALRALIRNYQHVQIVAAMGGGAGTGIAPVIAACCASENVEFSGIAVMPFSFEDRAQVAAEGYRDLHSVCKENVEQYCNDNILSFAGSMSDAMRQANEAVCSMVMEVLGDIPGLVERRTPPSGEPGSLLTVGQRVAAS